MPRAEYSSLLAAWCGFRAATRENAIWLGAGPAEPICHKRTKADPVLTCCCTLLHGGGRRVRKTARKQREPFGRIRQLPSRRYQAAYTGPDLALHRASSTFETLMDARAWLTDERRRIDAGNWIAPGRRNRPEQAATFGAFAILW